MYLCNTSISSITVLLAEQSSYGFRKRLENNSGISKISIVDVGSDYGGWKTTPKSTQATESKSAALRALLEKSAPASSKSVLLIDSIAMLAAQGHSETSLASLVAELKPTFSSIVLVAHTDVLPSKTLLPTLESTATTIIELLPVPLHPVVDVTGSFSMLQKRKNSKVSRSVEYFHASKSSKELTFYTEAQVIRKQDPSKTEDAFKHKMDQLTPEQEAARAAVALPYARARQTASQSVSGLPELSLDVPVEGAVYVDPEDQDPDGDTDLDDF